MKNEQPLVSVAIITYNQKEFLRECIESCLDQDYSNVEIVVADDGSTDGTHEMMEEYSNIYPGKFILRLSKLNQGITPNSNAAHFACSGKYIAWMGGDDLMLPGKLSKQVTFMEANHSCTMCYHDLDVFESRTGSTLYFQSTKVAPRIGAVSQYIKYGVVNGACSTMVRRDKTPVHGFHKSIPVASDWLYWVESLLNGGSIQYINEVLGKYRRHENNVTNKASTIGQNYLDHLNSCNYIASNYPQYFHEAIYCYAMNIRSNRHKLPYLKSLWFSYKVTWDIKSIFCILIHILTFLRVKL